MMRRIVAAALRLWGFLRRRPHTLAEEEALLREEFRRNDAR